MWAQDIEIGKCATDYLESEMRSNDPELDAKFLSLDLQYAQMAQSSESTNKTSATILTVPVVVHVMYADQTDNITMDQILDAIDVLNEDFRRLNEDRINTRSIFQGVADDMEIEFKLARLDPNGNCTDGVNRVQTNLTINANDNVKPLSNWDNKKYLNIWVVRSISVPNQPTGTVLGYAYRPNPGQSFRRDGVVVRHDMMGRIGTAAGIGRTLTHEVGHYLGLQHPFENGCFGGDNCTDTPPVASASFGCNLNRNSCNNDVPNLPDQIENFMDYADDECTNMFTTQQKNIMRGNLNNASMRGYLLNGSNPSNTGIVDGQVLPCAPKAKYKSSPTLICEGESIQFEDQSLYGNPVSYNWTFTQGQPSTSTAKNPLVVYNTPGSHNVTLAVTNAQGNSIETNYGEVAVRPNSPVWINQFSEDFEAWNIPNNNWYTTSDVDTIQFYTTQNVGFNSSKSAKLNNYDIQNKHVVELVSNGINLSNSKSVRVTFDYAYTTKVNPDNQDFLRIFSSTDCGDTWFQNKIIPGGLLKSAPETDARFTPNSNAQWKQGDFVIGGANFEPNVLVKFEFSANGSGNNLYLDNIEIVTTIGIEEEKMGLAGFNVFPNPSHGDFNIEIEALKEDTYTVQLLDLNGRVIDVMLNNEKLNAGLHILNGNFEGRLADGVYLVNITNTNGSVVKRILIQ